MHERTVTLHRDTRHLVVEEAVESAGQHDCRLAFHIGPEVDCFLDGALAELSWYAGAVVWRAVMRLPQELAWSAVRGQADPPLGWYSPCFGARLPIITLVGNGVIAGGTRLTTDIAIELVSGRMAPAECFRAALARS